LALAIADIHNIGAILSIGVILGIAAVLGIGAIAVIITTAAADIDLVVFSTKWPLMAA
jgi:nucleoside phosphorylase